MKILVPSRTGFRHATDEQNHGAGAPDLKHSLDGEISPGSSAAD
jgi:hypothetical protein